MMKGVLLLSAVIALTYSAPIYGNDGGYRGFASYVPRKAASRSSVSSEDSLDTSAGSPEISRRPIKREEDDDSSSSIPYSPPKSPAKKYNILDYVPSRQHGYGNNKITEENPSSPYHHATLYGQSGGGYKIADTYQNQHIDSHSGSEEEDLKYDDLSNPQPYEYGYALKDDHGNEQHKHETSDGHGTVKGSYGFTDEHGFYRSVEYVADKGGFRASIKTNEPGTESRDPADVHVEAEKLEYK